MLWGFEVLSKTSRVAEGSFCWAFPAFKLLPCKCATQSSSESLQDFLPTLILSIAFFLWSPHYNWQPGHLPSFLFPFVRILTHNLFSALAFDSWLHHNLPSANPSEPNSDTFRNALICFIRTDCLGNLPSHGYGFTACENICCSPVCVPMKYFPGGHSSTDVTGTLSK